jgi:hypothetical protein
LYEKKRSNMLISLALGSRAASAFFHAWLCLLGC